MKLGLIYARSENDVIGTNGGLPWPKLSDDMKHFKDLTLGCTVIMGRKTWHSLPTLGLKDREGIVISSTLEGLTSASVARTFEEALEHARALGNDAWVIGGARVYQEAIQHPELSVVEETVVRTVVLGDTVFNAQLYLGRDWSKVSSRLCLGTVFSMTFNRYERKV